MSNQNHSSTLDLERLVLIAGGHTAFQLLWAGVELKLYDLLSENPGMMLQQIADKLKLESQPARILLVGLTALGLIEKQGEAYFNAPLTEQRLVSNKPGSAARILGWQRYIVYEGLVDFVQSLKENRNVGLNHFPGDGNTLYQRLTGHLVLEKVFQDSMSALSVQANSYLLASADFGGVTHLVDAGGGDGTNAISFAHQFPHLKVTIFDSPSVCEIAKKNIAEAGLQDKVDTWPGNFFTDPFPDGIDGILYAHIMTIWSPNNNLKLLQRTYQALPEGGSVLIFNMMAADDNSGPLSTALGSPYFLAIATGEGMLYPWKDYEKWLKQAGFTQTQRLEGLPLDHGLLTGRK